MRPQLAMLCMAPVIVDLVGLGAARGAEPTSRSCSRVTGAVSFIPIILDIGRPFSGAACCSGLWAVISCSSWCPSSPLHFGDILIGREDTIRISGSPA
jgi:hypothetical protein